jgi:hypothetical protein
MRAWGFTPEEGQVLMSATRGIPSLRAVLGRAVSRPDLAPDLLLVRAKVSELDEMYSLVEALMDGTRSRKRLDLLEGLLAGLCTSIDGF